MIRRIRVRRGPAADWSTINPILSQGEFGFSIDDQQLKIGNGSSPWNALRSLVHSDRSITIQGASSNQVLVAGGSQTLADNRTWSLSLPQDIHSGATPSFQSLFLTSASLLQQWQYPTDPSNIYLRLNTENPVGGRVVWNWSMRDPNDGTQNDFLTFKGGNVGIREKNPVSSLDIKSSAITGGTDRPTFRAYGYDSDSFFEVNNNSSNSANVRLTRSDATTVFSVDGHTGNGFLIGNLGIGVNPAFKLHVSGVISLHSSSNYVLWGANASVNPYIQGDSSNNLYFGTGGSSKMHYTTDGNLGIGNTVTASERLTLLSGNIKLFTLQNVADEYRYIGTEFNYLNGNNRAEIRFAIDGADTRTRLSFHVASGSGTIFEGMRLTHLRNLLVGITTDNTVDRLQVNGSGSFVNWISATSRFSSYTTDGLFNADARPNKFNTPSGGDRVLIGYLDQGGGQYWGRIGFSGNTNWSLGTGAGGNNFTIGIGNANSSHSLAIDNSGNVGINVDVIGGSISERLDINGNIRVRSLTTAIGDFITADTNGVFSRRTAAQVRSDLGLNTNYIQNQNSGAQTANYWISGTARIDGGSIFSSATSFQFLTAATGALSVDMGSLLVSDSYTDRSFVPINGAYIKGALLNGQKSGIVGADPFLYFSDDTSGSTPSYIQRTNSNGQLEIRTDGDMLFSATVARMRIVGTNGNVVINGSDNTFDKLQVTGSTSFNGVSVFYNSGAAGNYNENIRLPEASNGYAAIHMGGTFARSGTGVNQWTILKTEALLGHRFAIWHNGSQQLGILTDGTWLYNSPPAGSSETAAILRNAGTGALVTRTLGSMAFETASNYVPVSRLIDTQHSLAGGGSLASNRILSLVNDVSAPGASMFYGTNNSGVRGWYSSSVAVSDMYAHWTLDTANATGDFSTPLITSSNYGFYGNTGWNDLTFDVSVQNTGTRFNGLSLTVQPGEAWVITVAVEVFYASFEITFNPQVDVTPLYGMSVDLALFEGSDPIAKQSSDSSYSRFNGYSTKSERNLYNNVEVTFEYVNRTGSAQAITAKVRAYIEDVYGINPAPEATRFSAKRIR